MSNHCHDKSSKKNTKSGGQDNFIVVVVISTILVLGMAIFFGIRMGADTQVVADEQVVVSIESNSYDWGTIDLNAGIVSKSFEIKNTSESVLKLYDVQTSCTCTTAQLKTVDFVSQKFKMHDKSSKIFEVQPGESAQLVVEYDPAFHGPSGTGPIDRTVTISTNDVNNPIATFNLKANVVKN